MFQAGVASSQRGSRPGFKARIRARTSASGAKRQAEASGDSGIRSQTSDPWASIVTRPLYVDRTRSGAAGEHRATGPVPGPLGTLARQLLLPGLIVIRPSQHLQHLPQAPGIALLGVVDGQLS